MALVTLLSFWSGIRQSATFIQVGRRAFYAATTMVLLAAGVLEAALLTHDFSLVYVAEHTDLSTPTALVVAGFYGGQEGSLLYWTLILGLLGSASLVASASLGGRVAAYATGILAAILSFFLFVLAVVASPFELLAITPPDGLGLNPVLRDMGMLIHPPVVLAGFASFAIPFSFACAALLAGRVDAAWITHTRRFALLAWSLQTAGLLLGMWWAYHVLGWGGYWGWDPVENVALMPWLATTAYLHSAQVQERRGRLRAWNFGLVKSSAGLSGRGPHGITKRFSISQLRTADESFASPATTEASPSNSAAKMPGAASGVAAKWPVPPPASAAFAATSRRSTVFSSGSVCCSGLPVRRCCPGSRGRRRRSAPRNRRRAFSTSISSPWSSAKCSRSTCCSRRACPCSKVEVCGLHRGSEPVQFQPTNRVRAGRQQR